MPMMTPVSNRTGFTDSGFSSQSLDSYIRNKPFTDEELDRILPSTGYEIVKPPDGYQINL
jgi:splicing factor 3B subunit 1